MEKYRMGKKVEADFPESEVAINVSYYLAQLSSGNKRFWIRSISQSKERSLGYDARMSANTSDFVPFYMQFKRPFSYPHNSWSKIIRQRKRLKANSEEIALAFKFLPKKLHHSDFQHNILFNLSESGIGHAAYVCPLFTDGDRYSEAVRKLYFHSYPYEHDTQTVMDNDYYYEHYQAPFIQSHITIIPHSKVTHARHHYSFDTDGDDLCFHKPQTIKGRNQKLEEFVDSVFGDFKKENTLNIKSSKDALERLALKVLGKIEFEKTSEDIFKSDLPTIAMWGIWGHYLKINYGIQQFFMTRSE